MDPASQESAVRVHTYEDVTYEVGGDVALEWLNGGSLAMASGGSLTILQGGIDRFDMPIEPNSWPVELAFGGDLLAVCYPELRIEFYQLDEVGLPMFSMEPETQGQVSPLVTIEISPIESAPFSQATPSPRQVFAVRGDGNLVAMMGPDGNVSFGNPRTGWPNPIVSIRLPKDSGIPLAARFRGAGSVDGAEGEMVVTAKVADGSLVEWTLNPELTLWSEAKPVEQLAEVDAMGATRTFITPGNPNEVTCMGASGELLWTRSLGSGNVAALAGTLSGRVAVAAGGKLTVFAPR